MRNSHLSPVVLLAVIFLVFGFGVLPLTAASSEDAKLQELYVSAKYEEIAKRYRSSGRIRNLSEESRALLVGVLVPEHAGDLLKALGSVVSDDELANVALVAAVRSKRRVSLSEAGVRRLSRTRSGQMALALNARTLPPAPQALDPLRAARLSVIEEFFFNQSTPDARAEVLHTLVTLTTQAFMTGRFSPDVPPPPAGFEPKTTAHFALKLAILPYLDNPDTFVALFDGAVSGGPYVEGSK